MTNYYAETTYAPSKIPDQLPEPKKPWLLNFGKIRLPWGNTLPVVPIDMLTKFQVKNLRYIKKITPKKSSKKRSKKQII